tara:strand:- start:150 stop:413 length:264 start_codon:yes stop_codon:yes gene_type:complete
MYRIFNLLFLIIVVLFFFNIYNYYSSNKNIKDINTNRSNIEDIIKTKIINLPILKNDTNDVIEFNSSFSEQLKDDKPRSFWNLLKRE